MVDRFIAWLDDFLAERDSAAVVKAALGLMSFAVLLGALLGSAATKAGALVVVLLVLLCLGLLLLADRRAILRRLEDHLNLVAHYSRILVGANGTGYRIISWGEFVDVDADGFARKRLLLRGEALSDGLWVLRLVNGCGWRQPAKYRRKVDVVVRNLAEGGVPGPRLPLTCSWSADGRFAAIIHFRTPPPRGEEFAIVLECSWPGMCAPLMRDRVPDEFTLRFANSVGSARYRVALPIGCDAHLEPIGAREGEGTLTLARTVDERGQAVFEFSAFDPPPRQDLGMRLELKKTGVPA